MLCVYALLQLELEFAWNLKYANLQKFVLISLYWLSWCGYDKDVEGLDVKVQVVHLPEARPALKPAPVAALIMVEKLDVALQQDMAYNMDVRKYSYVEVEAISSNWKYKFGKGGFGTVYYGEIFNDATPNVDPQRVALKWLSATSQQGEKEFLNEVPKNHLFLLPGFTLLPYICEK